MINAAHVAVTPGLPVNGVNTPYAAAGPKWRVSYAGKGILVRLNRCLDRQALALHAATGALFCAAAFALLPKGFAWFGALLIACTLLVPERFAKAWRDHRPVLRWVLWMSLAVVALTVASMQSTGQGWSAVDNYARFLLLPWCRCCSFWN